MAAVYDVQVRNQLYNYEKSLRNYPIRANRRTIKVKRFRTFLQQLSRNVLSHPVCDKKKLGQIFDENGNVIFKALRQTTYQDESGTQWSISFFQVSKNTVKIYRLYQTSFVYESIAKNKTTILVGKSNLYKLVKDSIKQAVFEATKNGCTIPVKKKLGKWKCIDGQWWDGTPYGLEHKGLVQDVRMYDKQTNDDTFETIALFRRCDNKKFFYAQIVPIENSKETKWKPLPLSRVPEIIKNDIRNINPQGHEPYLPV